MKITPKTITTFLVLLLREIVHEKANVMYVMWGVFICTHF